MSKSTENLLIEAHEEGTLTQHSLDALTKVPDLGAIIQEGFGIPVENTKSSEVILLNVLVDDSFSIASAGNTKAVIQGCNAMLKAIRESKQQDNILVMIRTLNGKVICPYTPLALVPELDDNNYKPDGGTPLYDEKVKMFATVLAKVQEFKNNGIQVRSISLTLTDGEDVHSNTNTANDVKNIVNDMLRTEEHIIAAMGFDNGSCNFSKVFAEMGIPDQWALTAASNPSEIRKAFQVFSQSAIRASQSAAAFSQSNLGGFGT